MTKKTFNPLVEFGEFVSDITDGKIFDLFDKKATPDTEVKNAPDGNDGSGNDAKQPDKRGSGTFTTSTTKTGKGASDNRGNGSKGGNDGSGMAKSEGTETEDKSDKIESK
jgi:hypothetical protein